MTKSGYDYNESDVARVSKNAYFLFILQLVNYIAPLMVIPYLTRTLSVEGFGMVMIVFSVIQFSNIITDFGFSLAATYKISINRDNAEFINDLIGRIFSSKLILFLITSILIIFISLYPPYSEYRSLFYVAIAVNLVQSFQPIWIFQGVEKMKGFVAYMSITKIIYALMVLFVVDQERDAIWVIVSWFVSNSIGTVIALYGVYGLGYRLSFSTLQDSLEEIRSSSQYFWSRLSVSLYTVSGAALVGMSSLSQAALFSASEQVYKGGQSIYRPVVQAIYPYMANKRDWKLFNVAVFLMLFILVSISFIIFLKIDFFVNILFGSGYIEASPVISIFLVIILINFLGMIYGYPASSAVNRVEIANKSVIYGGGIFFVLVSVIFILSDITAYRMALCILLVEAFVMVYRIVFVIREKNKRVSQC